MLAITGDARPGTAKGSVATSARGGDDQASAGRPDAGNVPTSVNGGVLGRAAIDAGGALGTEAIDAGGASGDSTPIRPHHARTSSAMRVFLASATARRQNWKYDGCRPKYTTDTAHRSASRVSVVRPRRRGRGGRRSSTGSRDSSGRSSPRAEATAPVPTG